MTLEVTTQVDRLGERLEAHLAWFAGFDVGFYLLAGGGVQFSIDVFGKSFEKCQTVLVIMVGIILFHSNFSVLP